MNDIIIQTIITATAIILTSVISGLITGGKVIYRIDQLEKKVEKYNNLRERMGVAEVRIDEIKETLQRG